jgi:hypothetical protein
LGELKVDSGPQEVQESQAAMIRMRPCTATLESRTSEPMRAEFMAMAMATAMAIAMAMARAKL